MITVEATKIAYLTALVLSWAAACLAQEDTWSEEPPLTMWVTIGDQTFEIENGKASTISIDGRDQPITVTAAHYRTFDKSGVRFDYPASFKFEKQKPIPGEGPRYCVLEGNGVSIHVKEHVPKLDFAAFVEYVREKHKNLPTNLHTVDERNDELRSVGARVKGIAFELTGDIGGQRFRQLDRCFVLPSSNKDCCIFLIIVTTGEEGEDLSRDAIHSLTVLEKTLTIAGNP